MLLRVIPMFCFGILRIFEEKLQKSKRWKFRHFGLLRRSIGNPRRGVDLRQGVGCLAAARLRCQNGTLWVRRGVDTVHIKQIFGLLFRRSSIHTPIVKGP